MSETMFISVPTALEMQDVSVGSLRDPGAIVLEDVNWRVLPGEYWVIAGMQGCGKSDFLSLAAGLTAPVSGAYRLFGRDMPIYEGALLRERLRIGLVFDGGHLLHQLTVRENVALPLRYHRNLEPEEARGRVQEVLDLTGLAEWADSPVGTLRRHVRKRAGLARALIMEPDVLLLDNPLSGLDLRQSQWVLTFLAQLSTGHERAGGKPVTVIATTEDLRPWRDRASQFGLLQDRHFIPLGRGHELGSHPDPLVRELLSGR